MSSLSSTSSNQKHLEDHWKNKSKTISFILQICGIFITLLGLFLFVGLFASIIAPEEVLKLLLGKLKVPFKSVAGSSWAQVAVAFGMHRFCHLFFSLSFFHFSLYNEFFMNEYLVLLISMPVLQ